MIVVGATLKIFDGHYVMGMGIGSIMYYLMFQIFCKVMMEVFNCEALCGFDSIFLMDDK